MANISSTRPLSSIDEDGELDLVVAATPGAVMMVESEAKELTEDEMLGAVMFAHDACKDVANLIIDLAEQAAKDPWELDPVEDKTATLDELRGIIGA